MHLISSMSSSVAKRHAVGKRHLDTTTIVLDLHELEATIFDCDPYGRRSRIQTILQKLLECRSWTVYYLNMANRKITINKQ